MSAGPVCAPVIVNCAVPDVNVPATMARPPAGEPLAGLAAASDPVGGPTIDGAAAFPHAATANATTNADAPMARIFMRLSLSSTRREVARRTALWHTDRLVRGVFAASGVSLVSKRIGDLLSPRAYDRDARLMARLCWR
jgi:hypothetical protein